MITGWPTAVQAGGTPATPEILFFNKDREALRQALRSLLIEEWKHTGMSLVGTSRK